MFANVGGFDRIFRLVAGAIVFLVAVFAVKSAAWTVVLAILGAVLFLTGLTRRCLAYVPFGLNSYKRKMDQK